MNTLNRDRNTLKRLVESYGKKDVLNFVRHLNEGIFRNRNREARTVTLHEVNINNSLFLKDILNDYSNTYNKNVEIDNDTITIEYTIPTKPSREQFDEFSSFYKCFDACYRSIPAVKLLLDYYLKNEKMVDPINITDKNILEIEKMQAEIDKFVSREEVFYINSLADQFGVYMNRKVDRFYKFQRFINKFFKKYSLYDRTEAALSNTQRSIMSNARIRHMNESADGYDFLDYDDSYDVFNGNDSDMLNDLFEKYDYEISVIANIPELLNILKRKYPDFKIINNSHKWAIVLWNPDEDTLAPGYVDDDWNEYAVELLPYDDSHVSVEEANRCWNLYKQAYIDTLP